MTTINTSLLDGIEALGDIEAPASLIVAYSQAVSLKRIADILSTERVDYRVEEAAPAPADPIIRLYGGAAQGSMAEAVPVPLAVPPVLDPPLPAGFAPVAGSLIVDLATGSPVDRNAEVMVWYAGGKKRKAFAGSVNWRASDPTDPWRPVGYRVLGDGATVASES